MSVSQSLYPVPAEWRERAYVNAERYADMYAGSLADPDSFWGKQAQRLDWITPFSTIKQTSFDEADFGIQWFADGTLNLAANCLDRHLADARGSDRDPLGGRRSRREPHDHLSRAP